MTNINDLLEDNKAKIEKNNIIIKGNILYRINHSLVRNFNITKNIVILASPFVLSGCFAGLVMRSLGCHLISSETNSIEPFYLFIVTFYTSLVGKFIYNGLDFNKYLIKLKSYIRNNYKTDIRNHKLLNELYKEDIDFIEGNYEKRK